eukprot:610341_1
MPYKDSKSSRKRRKNKSISNSWRHLYSVLTLIQNMAWFDALSETLLSLVRDPECLLYILWNKIMIRDAHPFCSIVGRFLGKKLSRHDQSKRYPIMFANIN